MLKHLLGISCILLLLCSCSKDSKLLNYVPADADIVVTINGDAVMQSAGAYVDAGVITLPAALGGNELDYSYVNTQEILFFSCFSHDNALSNGVFLFKVSDRPKFIDTIIGQGFVKEGAASDAVAYHTNSESDVRSHIVLYENNLAVLYLPLWMDKADSDIITVTSEWMAKAKKESFASTKAADLLSGQDLGLAFHIKPEYLGGNGLSAIDPNLQALSGGYALLNASLSGTDALEATAFVIDSDGKQIDLSELSPVKITPTKIDSAALGYLGADEVMILASSIKDVDWSTYLDNVSNMLPRSQRPMLGMVEPYISQIDGTVTIGVGPTQGLLSFAALDENPALWPDYVSCTAVVELKDGKADSTFGEISSLLTTFGMGSLSDGNTLTVPLGDFNVHMAARGNFLIVSDRPISNGSSTNAAVRTLSWTDYCSAWGLVLTPDNQLMKDLSLSDYTLSAVMYNTDTRELHMRLTLSGDSSKGLIEQFFDMLTVVNTGFNE